MSASNFLGMALGPFLGATVLERFDLGPALVGAGLGGRMAFDLLVPGLALDLLPGRTGGARGPRLGVGRAARLAAGHHGRGSLDVDRRGRS